jgi:hypothetical protein
MDPRIWIRTKLLQIRHIDFIEVRHSLAVLPVLNLYHNCALGYNDFYNLVMQTL